MSKLNNRNKKDSNIINDFYDKFNNIPNLDEFNDLYINELSSEIYRFELEPYPTKEIINKQNNKKCK